VQVAPAQAIVNGTAVPEGALPFMASLQDGTGFAFCGGSVVSPDWVLTAAHCVADGDASDLWVVTGRTDLSDTSKGQRIKVSEVRVNPAYANDAHDTALLHLSTPTVSPAIALAGASDDDLEAAGSTVTVAGWGDTLPTMGLFATNQLQQVDLQVVSDDQCGQTNLGFDAPTGVCAAALLKDSCQGDSGGPLWAVKAGRRVQLGVVSYGQSCALPEFPGVYSEVNNAQIRGWITSVAGV
jgi:secreted trypsin-like serine protease